MEGTFALFKECAGHLFQSLFIIIESDGDIRKRYGRVKNVCYNGIRMQGGIHVENFLNQFKNWCVSFYEYVVNHVPVEVMIYIGIAVLILILISIISRMIKRRRAQKRLSELEADVNEIRQNGLQSKYTKALAFAKANDDLTERVEALKPKYEICLQSVTTCENLYEKAFDELSHHKYKKCVRTMDEVETVLEDTEERIRIVMQSIDNVLSRESEVREKSQRTIDRFHSTKKEYENRREACASGTAYLDDQIDALQSLFEDYEERMESSEFKQAREDMDKIAGRLDTFEECIAKYPALYQKANTELPAQMDEVRALVKKMEEEKVDPAYLNVEDKLDAIENARMEAITRLDNGNLKAAVPAIEEITNQLLALQEDISTEYSAFGQIQKDLADNFAMVDQAENELNEITRLYASIKDRFGLEDWTKRFIKAREQIDLLKVQRDEIQKQLDESDVLQVETVSGYRTFSLKIEAFGREVSDMKQMLLGASSDESRAKKQLTKLQLILNEVRLNTSMKQLPSISDSFETDLEEGEKKIADVQKILDTTPLNVEKLNDSLQEAIDFIYKLYSNASNLVGVAVMVENAIVFGNRFRSSYPALDSDLNKAEICFQNGEYTRALKIAIQAIETLHPGIYEKLVARKDPAVMNQV